MALTQSCSRRAAPALTREAFLTFDNLTGDASLDWIARAAPRMLEHDLTGVPKTIPLAVPTLRDAYLEHASRLVHGYYELRSGKLHFEIAVEDATGHRILQTTAEEGQPGEAMNRAADSLASGARPFPAPDAVAAAWGQGDFERAAKLDPGFALAWLSWAEQLSAQGDNARALEVAQRGLAQPQLDSPIDRGRLELAVATLRQDDAGRLEATRKLAGLIPYDPGLLTALAELDMSMRNFASGAQDYQRVFAANPGNTAVLNSLGYAQALAGDLDGARKSFQEYGRGPGENAVNSIDSLGEALFMNGKFDEAERQFLAAYQKDPKFVEGETLWKAAHARWLAGLGKATAADRLGASDQLADQYFALRAKAHDPLVTWRRANWLYETGRRQQAVDLLTHTQETTVGAAAAAKQQLQVWDNPQLVSEDLAKLEQAYRHSDPVNDGLARTLYAQALVHAGKTAEARELLKRWPLPVRDNSTLQSLMYPTFLELRKALD